MYLFTKRCSSYLEEQEILYSMPFQSGQTRSLSVLKRYSLKK